MTRLNEAEEDRRFERRAKKIARAVDGGLAEAVGRAGGEYQGLSAKHNPVECLLIIKAIFPAGAQVAFCGSNDLGSALIKAMYEASRDNLQWRADRYGGES
jgi:hypothetical protein